MRINAVPALLALVLLAVGASAHASGVRKRPAPASIQYGAKGVRLTGRIWIDLVKDYNGNGMSRRFIRLRLDRPISISGEGEEPVRNLGTLLLVNDEPLSDRALPAAARRHVAVTGYLSGGNHGPMMFVSNLQVLR